MVDVVNDLIVYILYVCLLYIKCEYIKSNTFNEHMWHMSVTGGVHGQVRKILSRSPNNYRCDSN